ncbi:DUF1127 domain-containing protein [Hafnia psychrotolerans]|uniref:YjiS-like domain-containing protein n=1 Tax=Hafnia psychrotolerans TaxID=1477018 RepID=A0ABQ1G0Z6_9GAMM|nr:DUF1127 domain-containing protein [Hafnia psychrotolerans]GGA34955.1 hypothetical protein GCM10011328_07100 [Hafnia psychrotolerans]
MKNIIEERQFCGCSSVVRSDSTQEQSATVAEPKSAGWLKKTVQKVKLWNEQRVSRKILLSLSADQLKDIGLTQDDIHKEYERKVWPSWPK